MWTRWDQLPGARKGKIDADQPAQAAPAKRQRVGADLKVVTWNINGLRSVSNTYGSLKKLLEQFEADIVCFQETKITRAHLDPSLALVDGYHAFFSFCSLPRKKHYSGVATFVRRRRGLRTLAATSSLLDNDFFGGPLAMGSADLSAARLVELDAEGRVVVTDHGHLLLFNVYAPCISSSEDSEQATDRRSFKVDFNSVLEGRLVQACTAGRDVLLVGDLNACATPLDCGFPMSEADFRMSSWSKWIRRLVGMTPYNQPPTLVDCFRCLHPARRDAFTCWNTKTGARQNNYGTRIDYILSSARLAQSGVLSACDIMPEQEGSDHCPVHAVFSLLGLPEGGSHPGPAAGPSCAAASGATSAPLPEPDNSRAGLAPEGGEHPPQCSCFFPEFAGRQETLKRYFSGSSGGSGGGRNGSGAGGGEGVAGSVHPSAKAATWPPLARQAGEGGASVASSSAAGPRTRAPGIRGPGPGGKSGAGRAGAARGGQGDLRQSKLRDFLAGGTPPATRASSPSLSSSSSSSTTTAAAAAGTASAGPLPTPAAAAPPTALPTPSGLAPMARLDGKAGQSAALGGSAAPSGCGDIDGTFSSASAWSKLFRPPKTPLCQHGEPSIQRTVLKSGPNQNRRFFTCARPAGNWPVDRQARCEFFKWRTDGVRGYKEPNPSISKRSRGD